MNPTEIYDALCDIVAQPFNAAEFPYQFALATDTATSAVAKLRSGSTNKSDLPGGVLSNGRFHYVPAPLGKVGQALALLEASKKSKTHKAAILLTTDGEDIAAKHPASGETLHIPWAQLGEKYDFFLPAAGKERYRALDENPVDIKATAKLARLYDALLRTNPEWKTAEHRHDMNKLMMRIIFCLFAEDVSIFPENQFSRLLHTHAGQKGEGVKAFLELAFQAMNLPQDKRGHLPGWCKEIAYVNGGLFAGKVEAPTFDGIAYRYLDEACKLDWKEINPDIFGSMIQSVADAEQRSELGMHYTSVPNIMKVLGPLFLDELDQDIQKAWDKAKDLEALLKRLSKIRVFDPACGSGNFLVVAYRQLRERELRIVTRLSALKQGGNFHLWSNIGLNQFYGIDIADFATETAKLALIIAEYQANALFAKEVGRPNVPLPLSETAHIVTGNALRLNWESICPPPKEDEVVYIAGNPPFLGSNFQTKEQKADLAFVFKPVMDSFASLDLVCAWFLKASNYVGHFHAKSAFVATNSICQGQSVPNLWPHLLKDGIEIEFAHKDFNWKNNASDNAAVICSIIGLSHKRHITAKRLFISEIESKVSNINTYLLNAPHIIIKSERRNLFDLPEMDYGNKPADGGFLLLSEEEKEAILNVSPEADKFIKRFMGSQEVVKGIVRYCVWVEAHQVEEVTKISVLNERFSKVRDFRLASSKVATQKVAHFCYRFDEVRFKSNQTSLLIPSVSSERRPYLPVVKVGKDVISSNLNQVLYDAPDWCLALIASRLHLVWIGTVCGRLESRFRYSNTLGWNTFPVPQFTPEQLNALNRSAQAIIDTRDEFYPATIAELYDPDKMPDKLREVHRQNDELLEAMYIGRPFRNDTERLEHLFKLYAAKVKSLAAKGAKA